MCLSQMLLLYTYIYLLENRNIQYLVITLLKYKGNELIDISIILKYILKVEILIIFFFVICKFFSFY